MNMTFVCPNCQSRTNIDIYPGVLACIQCPCCNHTYDIKLIFQIHDESVIEIRGEHEPSTMAEELHTVLDDFVDGISTAEKAAEEPDQVFRPAHYAHFVIEPITFIMVNDIPFPEGNIIKYVCRWRYKNGIEDLEKARRYIDMLIELEKNPEKYREHNSICL